MSRYCRHNPDEPVRHDWFEGGERTPLSKCRIQCADGFCGASDCRRCFPNNFDDTDGRYLLDDETGEE